MLNYQRVKKWALAATAGLLAVTVSAEDSAVEALKAKLQQADALRGSFEQRLLDRDGHELQKTEGEFVVQRPGNFYWETHPPYEQVVVGNGKTLWVYDPDLEQVTVHRQDQQQQMSPAQLLSGELEDLEEDYRVERESQGDITRFTLVSQASDGLFSRLRLDYHNGNLAGLQFSDNMGQVTQLDFSNLEKNPQVDPAIFHFDVPEGVDVIVDD